MKAAAEPITVKKRATIGRDTDFGRAMRGLARSEFNRKEVLARGQVLFSWPTRGDDQQRNSVPFLRSLARSPVTIAVVFGILVLVDVCDGYVRECK